MRFKCSIENITTQQLAICSAVDSAFRQQSSWSEVLSLDPIKIKAGLTIKESQFDGLITKMLEHYLLPQDATIERKGTLLVIQTTTATEPIKRRRKRASKGNVDIPPGEGQAQAEPVA